MSNPVPSATFLDMLAHLDTEACTSLARSLLAVDGSLTDLGSARLVCKALRDGIDANTPVLRPELNTVSGPLLASGDWLERWPRCREVELRYSLPDRNSLLARGGLLRSFLAAPLSSRQRVTNLTVTLGHSFGVHDSFPKTAIVRLLSALPELRAVDLEGSTAALGKTASALLFSALASLPHLSSLTLSGCGCGLLGGSGCKKLTASTQLTRLVIKHRQVGLPFLERFYTTSEDEHDSDDAEAYDEESIYGEDRDKYDAYDYCESKQRCPYDNAAVLAAIKALPSLQHVEVLTHDRAVSPADVQALLDALPPSVKWFGVSGIQRRSFSLDAEDAEELEPDREANLDLRYDSAARSLELGFPLADQRGLAWFIQGALLGSRLVQSGQRFASLQLTGTLLDVLRWDTEFDDADQLQPLLRVLGVPRWLEVGERSEEVAPAERSVKLRDGGSAAAGSGAAEREPAPAVTAKTVAAEFMRRLCSQPGGPASGGGSSGGGRRIGGTAYGLAAYSPPPPPPPPPLVALSGPAARRAVVSDRSALWAVQQLERAAAQQGTPTGSSGPSAAVPQGSLIAGFLRVPEHGVVMQRGRAPVGVGDQLTATRVGAVRLAEAAWLANLSQSVTVQAAWDGAALGLTRLQRFESVLEVWGALREPVLFATGLDGRPMTLSRKHSYCGSDRSG
ncbi:hypothetical protein HYH03_015327 [Edaphochlamys debaryana]|uniref:Uncharacterized protein n=1 Tax=Edaphochlamys debaryana TaxID=47281 RepID=A0A835XM35_9CHLO|nr:hypothetical protein HYH03_015327 [Edaphochlamys debaryana]|eukprot:KAG2486014.1 hypothetical protein HYH03_015327 [Edaphochlamys debaryana]